MKKQSHHAQRHGCAWAIKSLMAFFAITSGLSPVFSIENPDSSKINDLKIWPPCSVFQVQDWSQAGKLLVRHRMFYVNYKKNDVIYKLKSEWADDNLGLGPVHVIQEPDGISMTRIRKRLGDDFPELKFPIGIQAAVLLETVRFDTDCENCLFKDENVKYGEWTVSTESPSSVVISPQLSSDSEWWILPEVKNAIKVGFKTQTGFQAISISYRSSQQLEALQKWALHTGDKRGYQTIKGLPLRNKDMNAEGSVEIASSWIGNFNREAADVLVIITDLGHERVIQVTITNSVVSGDLPDQNGNRSKNHPLKYMTNRNCH